MRLGLITCMLVLLAGCAGRAADAPAETAAKTATNAAASVSILVLGDTGYDYAYLEPEERTEYLTGRAFIENELDDWIEDHRPVEEFQISPMHRLQETGGWVAASGLWPVSKAMAEWCRPDERCAFGVMLGDNVYPAGGTLGADGHDDAQRFDDLLRKPYQVLKEQDPHFVLYPVLGNHDWDTSREGAMAQVAWFEQSSLYDMDGIWYRRRPAPDVEIFAIDTTVLLAAKTVYEDALAEDGTPIDTGEEDREEPWSEPVGDEKNMVAWLEQALAESDARWKIVIGHHPLWSSSGTKHEESKVLRRLLMPSLCRYADTYVAGHDHTLELHSDDCTSEGAEYASRPPLVALVSGAGSKQRPINSAFMRWRDAHFPQQRTLYARGLLWGFAEVVVDDDTLAVTIVSTPDSGSGEPVVEYRHTFEGR
ncbi:MAG TPA: metallophosphoesterase [Pseudomonadales bacterium]